MVIPKTDIEAMCDYIEADLEMGVQMNFSDWRESLAKVREWLGAVEQPRAVDLALPPVKVCPVCKRVVTVKRNGTMIYHKTAWKTGKPCDGSGQPYVFAATPNH